MEDKINVEKLTEEVKDMIRDTPGVTLHKDFEVIVQKEPTTFTCVTCGGIFYCELTDEEVDKEYEKNNPGKTASNRDVVCEDCYKNTERVLMGENYGK